MAKDKKVEKTFVELVEIDQMIGKVYGKNPALKDGKFGYAYAKFNRLNYKPTADEYSDRLNDIRIENALEDKETGEIMVDLSNPKRGFKYSKDGLKTLMRLEKKLEQEFDAKIIIVEPYFSKVVPKEFTEDEKAMLSGLVIE